MGAKIVCFNPTRRVAFPPSNDFVIQMSSYDIKSEEKQTHVLIPINSPNDVVKRVSKINVIKVKVALFYSPYNDEYIEIIKSLKQYYQEKEIPFFCCSEDSIYYSSILLSFVEEFGEGIIGDCQTLLIIYDDRKYSHEISARSIEIKKANDYFYFEDIELIKEYETMNYTDEEFQQKFAKTSKVFVYFEDAYCGPNQHQEKTFKLISAKLKNCTFYKIRKSAKYFEKKALIRKALKFLGKKDFHYEFATLTNDEYILGAWEWWMKNSKNPRFNKRCLAEIDVFERIPAKKTIVFYETFEKIVLCTGSTGFQYEGIETPAVPKIGLAATFSVDSFFTPSVIVHRPTKAVDDAVIIKFDHAEFSVEIVKNGKLESIGLDKVPLMISFINDRMQIGEEAEKLKEKHKSFVLTNLLTTAANIEHDSFKDLETSDWGFRIKQNAKFCKYLIFNTFRGQRKTTISYLFALLIKWGITHAEIKLQRMPKTVVVVADRMRGYLKWELENACNKVKLENIDMQISQYKIVQIKD